LALGWAAQGGLRLALQRWRGRRAAARGARGERRARALLERAGYRVLAEQPRHLATLRVSGRGERYLLVPDFLCERHGRRYVADAKTGAGADPSARATRRQLLEYACAFGVQEALLVDGSKQRALIGLLLLRYPEFRVSLEELGSIDPKGRPLETAISVLDELAEKLGS